MPNEFYELRKSDFGNTRLQTTLCYIDLSEGSQLMQLVVWLLSASVQMRMQNGAGNGSFLRQTAGRTPRPEKRDGITFVNPSLRRKRPRFKWWIKNLVWTSNTVRAGGGL